MLSDSVIADRIRERLAPLARLTAIYLFGSAVRGEQRDDSDVDVAVLADHPLDPGALFDCAQELAAALGRDMDLIDLASAPATLRTQIVGHGRRLHVGDERRVAEFEMYALSDYARLNEERRELLDAFEARYRA